MYNFRIRCLILEKEALLCAWIDLVGHLLHDINIKLDRELFVGKDIPFTVASLRADSSELLWSLALRVMGYSQVLFMSKGALRLATAAILHADYVELRKQTEVKSCDLADNNLSTRKG